MKDEGTQLSIVGESLLKAVAAADLHKLVVALFPAEDFVAASFAVAVVHVGALDDLFQPVLVVVVVVA